MDTVGGQNILHDLLFTKCMLATIGILADTPRNTSNGNFGISLRCGPCGMSASWVLESVECLVWLSHGRDGLVWFCCSGRIPRLSLNQHSLYVGVVENLLPHHSQGSGTERWSRNTLRVLTARVFYVLRGFLTSPFILNNSVETAAPFNVASHPRCSEPRN